ncbi:MAG: hypothetical protein FD145_1438 [Candidatus Saganbacteria bacterium]|uniref:DUF3006 domain-containing protein n=1 Tax=Candidatus Saganbacteria bacterium TaxID=2575572 RepID=A0A833L2S7_UNCSA|nr:MAG: hypothetical protein FD145_1438 [Candidatus Saganbacteria bacterium]
MKKEIKIKAIIDRIEGDKAILLFGEDDSAEFPIGLLPQGAKESDILTIKINLKDKDTEKAKQKAAEMIKKLVKRECHRV